MARTCVCESVGREARTQGMIVETDVDNGQEMAQEEQGERKKYGDRKNSTEHCAKINFN